MVRSLIYVPLAHTQRQPNIVHLLDPECRFIASRGCLLCVIYSYGKLYKSVCVATNNGDGRKTVQKIHHIYTIWDNESHDKKFMTKKPRRQRKTVERKDFFLAHSLQITKMRPHTPIHTLNECVCATRWHFWIRSHRKWVKALCRWRCNGSNSRRIIALPIQQLQQAFHSKLWKGAKDNVNHKVLSFESKSNGSHPLLHIHAIRAKISRRC